MQNIYYASLSIFSFILLLIYLVRWHKHLDVHMTVVFVLVPIINLLYFMMYANRDLNAAMVALKIIYIGACFLPWTITLCVASLCNIRVNRLIRMGAFLVSTVMYGFVLTAGHFTPFYRSVSSAEIDGAWVMVKEYGPVHNLHYVFLALYLIADLALILYAYREKKQVSRIILLLLFLPIPISVFGYLLNSVTIKRGIELVPLTYALAQLIYLFIVHRMAVYNVGDMVVESMAESGDTGFITVDFKGRYLGSNETAREILPDLEELSVDAPIGKTVTLQETVQEWIERFSRDPNNMRTFHYRRPADLGEEEERVYSVSVDYLSDGRQRRGYQVFLSDDTQNQKYINLLDQYNSDLQKDVAAKTERLIAMQNRLILGMAAMVESRDNSTGGHIRRTSEGVRILTEQMKKDRSLGLSEEFCRNLIKAAPMHDLGKIAVDDAVLRKNGPFTPEEREKMKQHAAEGARIVHSILEDTDDAAFRRIAENVAHYHHEKVDGTGYPDGLSGDKIPLEARIMAIADVYDALVSKRVYKEKFSFEEANEIILNGMGTQFDPMLRPYYEKARPRLEAYYSSAEQV